MRITDSVIKKGLDYLNDSRVFDLDWSDTPASDLVEGSRRDQPYSVLLSHDANDQLNPLLHLAEEKFQAA